MRLLRRLVPLVLLAALLAAAGWIWLNRDFVRDWLVLRDYQPPAAIAKFAKDTAMTNYATRLFYINKPTLDDKIALNQHCKNLGEEAAVLGCFRGDRLGIHIYKVTDERLKGIEQVTAAHEMLHQAYIRLSEQERRRIDQLLKNYAANELTDESLLAKLEIYKITEPNEISNEMHSLFGTELANLPSELEGYYSQYFTDRRKVVAYRDQSQAAFDEYRRQLDNFDKRLAELKPEIGASEIELNQQYAALTAKKKQLDADLAAQRIEEYNANVAPYNVLVNSYNAQLAKTNQLIEEYNQIVKQRNEIAIQATSLNEAINSRLPEE